MQHFRETQEIVGHIDELVVGNYVIRTTYEGSGEFITLAFNLMNPCDEGFVYEGWADSYGKSRRQFARALEIVRGREGE